MVFTKQRGSLCFVPSAKGRLLTSFYHAKTLSLAINDVISLYFAFKTWPQYRVVIHYLLQIHVKEIMWVTLPESTPVQNEQIITSPKTKKGGGQTIQKNIGTDFLAT